MQQGRLPPPGEFHGGMFFKSKWRSVCQCVCPPFCTVPPCFLVFVVPQLSMHEGFASYMETTMQLATTQGVVLPPRSTASKSAMANVRRALLHSRRPGVAPAQPVAAGAAW